MLRVSMLAWQWNVDTHDTISDYEAQFNRGYEGQISSNLAQSQTSLSTNVTQVLHLFISWPETGTTLVEMPW